MSDKIIPVFDETGARVGMASENANAEVLYDDGGDCWTNLPRKHKSLVEKVVLSGFDFSQKGDWHNLTERIAAGADIDWEKLDGVKARCVNAELGELTYKLERDSDEPEDHIWGWFVSDSDGAWIGAFNSAWHGWNGWTLYIDGKIPMKKKTADKLPLAMCFLGKHQSHGDPTVWFVLDNETDKVCIAPLVDGTIPASEIEVIEEFGIGKLFKENEK